MVHPCNGILSSYKKESSSDTCYSMMNLENIVLSERNQAQKETYVSTYMNSVVGKFTETERLETAGAGVIGEWGVMA